VNSFPLSGAGLPCKRGAVPLGAGAPTPFLRKGVNSRDFAVFLPLRNEGGLRGMAFFSAHFAYPHADDECVPNATT
jgi:hypothetical protein